MTKAEIDKTAREIIRRLKAAGDPKRRQAIESSLPTRLTVLGVAAADFKPIVTEIKKRFRDEPAGVVFALLRALMKPEILDARVVGWLVLAAHKGAMSEITEREVVEFARDMDNWGATDAYCVMIAGPAWREGRIGAKLIKKWARSADPWFRRMALVCTVPLNVKARGGRGDPQRTFEICHLLAADSSPMVAKALSWALRVVIQHDRRGVKSFLKEHRDHLPAIVRREVTNKLDTGLKTPRKARK